MKLKKLIKESKTPLEVGNQPVTGINYIGIPIDYHDEKSIRWPKGKPKPGEKISLMVNHRSRWVEIVSYHNMSGTFDLDGIEHGFRIVIDRDTSPERYIKRIDAYLEEI